jgi:hypothetical protein
VCFRGAEKFDRKKPSVVLEHSSPLQCVACHPERPSLVAVGSFGGELVLYDLGADEVCCSSRGVSSQRIGRRRHREDVVTVNCSSCGTTLGADEPLLAATRADDYFHREVRPRRPRDVWRIHAERGSRSRHHARHHSVTTTWRAHTDGLSLRLFTATLLRRTGARAADDDDDD